MKYENKHFHCEKIPKNFSVNLGKHSHKPHYKFSTGLTGYRFFLLLCNFAPSRNKATATDWIDKKPT